MSRRSRTSLIHASITQPAVRPAVGAVDVPEEQTMIGWVVVLTIVVGGRLPASSCGSAEPSPRSRRRTGLDGTPRRVPAAGTTRSRTSTRARRQLHAVPVRRLPPPC